MEKFQPGDIVRIKEEYQNRIYGEAINYVGRDLVVLHSDMNWVRLDIPDTRSVFSDRILYLVNNPINSIEEEEIIALFQEQLK